MHWNIWGFYMEQRAATIKERRRQRTGQIMPVNPGKHSVTNTQKHTDSGKGTWECHPRGCYHKGGNWGWDRLVVVNVWDKVCRARMWEACLNEKAMLTRMEVFADTESRLAENTHGQEQGNCGHFWCAYNFKVAAWISTGKYYQGMMLSAWIVVWMMLWYSRYLYM